MTASIGETAGTVNRHSQSVLRAFVADKLHDARSILADRDRESIAV